MSVLRQRVGTEQEEPTCILLTAGALTAELVGGNLAYHPLPGTRGPSRRSHISSATKTGRPTIQLLFELDVNQQTSSFTVRYRARCTDAITRQTLEYKADIVRFCRW